MIDALATRLRSDGADLRAGTPVDTLHRDNGGWEIAGERFDAVIVATPASVGSETPRRRQRRRFRRPGIDR